MELIDRAKVERITFQEPSYNDPINVLTEVRDKVRALPTVEAIPIKWIENYLRNYRYMAPIEKHFVREMIKAWTERKEE